MKDLDKRIKQRVQAVQEPLPGHVDRAFLEALDQIVPVGGQEKKRRFVYRGLLTAAATVLLAVTVVFFFLFIQQSDNSSTYVVEAGEVEVQDVYVEDEAASTFIINTKDPDITIIWVEKIKKENSDEKSN